MNNWSELFGNEWEYIKRLGASISDPDEKKVFWENVKQRKLEDPNFSIYSLFPKTEEKQEEPMSEKGAMAKRYCGEILEVLRRGKSA